MNVLGVELEYDFFDADQLEVYERENQRVADEIKDPKQYEGKGTADSIRIQCRIIDRFFDAVFGKGTAEKVFHGRSNIRDHMEAFGIVAMGAHGARGDLDAIEAKYSPDRAERRQAEKDRRLANKQNSRNFQYNAAGKNGKRRNH